MHFLTCSSSGVSLTLDDALLVATLPARRLLAPPSSASSWPASSSARRRSSPSPRSSPRGSPSSASTPARSYTRPPSLGMNLRPSFSTNAACLSGSEGPMASSISSADMRGIAASVDAFTAVRGSGVSLVSTAFASSAPSSSRRRLAAGVASAVAVDGDASGAPSEGAPADAPPPAGALGGALKKKDVMGLLFAVPPPDLPAPPGLGLPRFMRAPRSRADLMTKSICCSTELAWQLRWRLARLS